MYERAACDTVTTANPKCGLFPSKVRAQRNLMTSLVFFNFFPETSRENSVKLMGSRKLIENLFAERHLETKRFARQQCRAWIETIFQGPGV